MDQEKLKILTVYHKAGYRPKDQLYVPIQVNAEKSKARLDMLHDDEEDNISSKNSSYCELTGMYWAWKNYDCEYIGLAHYRRFFVFDTIETRLRKFFNYFNYLRYLLLHRLTGVQKVWKYKPIHKVRSREKMERMLAAFRQRVSQLLEQDTVVLARPVRYACFSIEGEYNDAHITSDLQKIREIIRRVYPGFLQSFDEIMAGNRLSHFNMLICHKAVYNDYCAWLFDILERLEQVIEVSADPFQQRVFGFIAERLLNVYFHKMQADHLMRVKYLDVIWLQGNEFD